MRKNTLYVGLDTDKKHIDVAVAEALPEGEVRYWGQVANTPASVERLVKKLGQGGRELIVCHEGRAVRLRPVMAHRRARREVPGRGAVDDAAAAGRSGQDATGATR